MKFRRHGDVNLYPITKAEFLKVKGKKIKHKGKYILAQGEATGSRHVISVKDPANLEIKQDDLNRVYYAIKNEQANITHTHDHETITAPPDTYYVQIPEREVDWFDKGITRRVID